MRHHLGTIESVFGRSACPMWGVTSAQYGQPTSGLILTGWGVFLCPLRRKLLHFTTDLGETFRISFLNAHHKQTIDALLAQTFPATTIHSNTLLHYESFNRRQRIRSKSHTTRKRQLTNSQESAVPKPKQYEYKDRFVTKFPQPTAISNGCQEWRLKRVETKDRRMQDQPR